MSTTKPDTDTGWSKEFRVVASVRERYWIRAGEQLAILQVNPSGRHEAIGSNTRYLASDFHGWEFLGPISPSDFEQLIRLRKETQSLVEAAQFALSTPGLIRGRDQLANAMEAASEALAHTGEQS